MLSKFVGSSLLKRLNGSNLFRFKRQFITTEILGGDPHPVEEKIAMVEDLSIIDLRVFKDSIVEENKYKSPLTQVLTWSEIMDIGNETQTEHERMYMNQEFENF